MLRDLGDDVVWTIRAIYALLVIATVVAIVLSRREPHRYAELWNRVRTWWIIIVLFTGALMLSRGASLAFFAFVSFLALKEFLSMIPTRRADRRVLFWAYLAIPLQYYWIHVSWYGMFIVFIPVYMFLLLPIRMITIGHTDGFLRAAGTIHWGLMTTVFCLSHAAFLLVLKLPAVPETSPTTPGPGLVVFLVALTQFNDIAQYCFGKALGRRKITPTVSPNKTWAGFVGGLFTTMTAAGFLGPWLTPLSLEHSLWGGAIIGLGGFIGDVTISAIKRDVGVKDCGVTLPGHGGVLDRIDSLTYTAPLFFHYVRYLYF